MEKPKSTLNQITLKLCYISVVIALVFQVGLFKTSDVKCGTSDFSVSLVIGGNKTEKGQWPYVAALYYADIFRFFCGGTVITTKHIMTGR